MNLSRFIDSLNEERILKLIIKGGLFLVFISPLIYFSKFFFPFIVPKNLLFRLIIEVIFVLYLFLAFKYPQYRPKVNFLNGVIILYFLVLVLTSLTGLSFLRSLWGNYERMDGLLNHFHLLLYFILLVSVLRERKEWYQLFSFSLASSFMMSMFALGQKLDFSFLIHTDNLRLAGTIGNASFFASYLVFHFFFLIFFLFKPTRFQIKSFLTGIIGLEILFFLFVLSKGSDISQPIFADMSFWIFALFFNAIMLGLWLWYKNKIAVFSFLLLFLLLNFFILFNTGTRGALLGVIAGLFFILLLFSLRGSRKRKIIAALVLVIGISCVVFVFLNKESDWVKNNSTLSNITSTSLKSVTVESRLITWQSSWQGITASPFRFVFGYGLENYDSVFDKYFNPKIIKDSGSRIWFDRAHSIVFDIWVTSGALGLVSFLSILAAAFVYLFKVYLKDRARNRDLFFIFSALLVGYFIQNLFVFDTLNTYILLFLCLAFTSFIFNKDVSQKPQLWPEKSINLGILSKAAMVGVLVLIIWFFNIRIALANTNLVKGALYNLVGVTKQGAFDYFEEALSYGFIGRFEAVQQLSGFARDVAADENIPKDFALEVTQKTIEEFERDIEINPANIKHYLYLGSLYNDVLPYFNNQYPQVAAEWPQKSIEAIDEAINLGPTRPQLYFVKGRALAYQSKFDEAINVFKQGIALAPNIGQYQVDLLVLYLIFDRPDLVDEQIEIIHNSEDRGWTFTVRDYERLANIYDQKGLYGRIPEMYVRLTGLLPELADKKDPQYVHYYAKAAGAFARIGDNEKAKEWAWIALELDPSVEAEIQDFIRRVEKGEFLDEEWLKNNAQE